ncbi:hypothetical protein SPI_09254 [Niveomyces insectorum RCEF 264]|uniref:Uncharacterized protein n=1 Tax=Niveomyces insectorum RCEF 264 TaxID=1081102 RepID=A0A167M1U0_9HYPO|nr:hypothetical protein SPI_09254 [Niveomyces insectorum RCEF 264]
MEIPDDNARAPLRAHILASINPFNGARGTDDGRSSRGSHGSRRRRAATTETDGGGPLPQRRPSSHDGSKRSRERSRSRGDAKETREGRSRSVHDDDRNDRNDRDLREHHDERAGDDDKLRPRRGKLRLKPRRKDEQDRTRYRSRDYESRDEAGPRSRRESEPDEDLDYAPRAQSSTAASAGDARDNENDPERHRARHHRRHHRHHHHRHHRHRRRHSHSPSRSRSRSPGSHSSSRQRRRRRRPKTTTPGATADDDEAASAHAYEEEDPYADPPLDPDAAFRQSLFDAMADDEGAAYWEAIYGQPVHEYAAEAQEQRNKKRQNKNKGDEGTADGFVDAMTDDEYADYVRRRIRRWQTYAAAWAQWEAAPSPAMIPWPPVKRDSNNPSRKADNNNNNKDPVVDEAYRKEVRGFFTEAGPGDGGAPLTESALLARLREERVRWHPDKMQQRLGGRVDAGVMKQITAIFQVVDRLWGELRGKR